jgi:predicted RNase H-like nuclease
MADKEYRRRLGLEPGSRSYSNYRVCEYELRRRGINLYNTPLDPQQAKAWMQEGWKLYARLREAGFVEYPHPGARRMFETFPHGGFAVLAGRKPYPKSSVRGLLQRQLILFDEGVAVPDPMLNLEEWTRHRIMTGQLSQEGLYKHDQLDALMAAYTAFKAEKEPREVIRVGDSGEGQIVLPAATLRDAY